MSQKIRVAYFVPPSEHFAGIERVVHEIASGLMESHSDVFDVHVIFASQYDDELLVKPAYTLHLLGADRLRNLAGSLRKVVARLHPDVLVCPQVEASVIAWTATRGLRLPVFLAHLHGNPRLEESDGSRRTRVAFALFRYLISRQIDGVLAVSPSLADYARESVTKHAPVYFVKNPVRDLDLAGERIERQEVFRFLNVARLSRQKGQDILLRALALARPDLPPVTLTFVGSGPDEGELRLLSAELGLQDIVVFAGYHTDPTEYFGSADCFVLSSRWEGFGVVLVEALNFGLPLLASDCEFGPADIITDPRIGHLVSVDSPESLAEGLKLMARTQDTRDAVTHRRKIAQSYSRSEATAMHFKILIQIINSGSRANPRKQMTGR